VAIVPCVIPPIVKFARGVPELGDVVPGVVEPKFQTTSAAWTPDEKPIPTQTNATQIEIHLFFPEQPIQKNRFLYNPTLIVSICSSIS
jgi:hypothetical protein